MGKITSIIKKEIKDLIPAWFFFFFSALIILLYRSLLLAQYGISIKKFYMAAIFAAVVAKVFLIVDAFKAVNRYEGKPLIYPILWKTSLYLIGAVVVQYIEMTIEEWKHAPFADAQSLVLARMQTPKFWALQLWLVTLFTIYISAREFIRYLGPDEFWRIFLGRKPELKRREPRRAA